MMDKDLKALYVFALRYALPRHSYAFDLVAPQILAKIKHFRDWEIKGMIDDCRIFYPDEDLGGATCDQPAVDRFKARLEEILKERMEA